MTQSCGWRFECVNNSFGGRTASRSRPALSSPFALGEELDQVFLQGRALAGQANRAEVLALGAEPHVRHPGPRTLSESSFAASSCAAAGSASGSVRAWTSSSRASAPKSGLVRGQQHRAGLHPTNASWLNWSEPEHAATGYFALNDHRSHDEQKAKLVMGVRPRWYRIRGRHLMVVIDHCAGVVFGQTLWTVKR
ncbi:hypothetical protein [Bounagaea algeriensis]